MTNKEAQYKLTDLETAIEGIRQAIDENCGYATCIEVDRLKTAYTELQRVIEKNNWNNIPF